MEGVVARALFLVRVNEVVHLGRKNLVSFSCGPDCLWVGVRASPSSLSAWGVLGEWSGDLD